MSRGHFITAASLCGASMGIGLFFGTKYEKLKKENKDHQTHLLPQTDTKAFFVPSVFASSSIPATTGMPAAFPQSQPVNRVSEIMKFGFPSLDQVRSFDNFVLSYDRRNRNAQWVFEHIKPEHVMKNENIKRGKSEFMEDNIIHKFFRATNSDFKNSGYDRGHLAAAANHRHAQKAMDQTFTLSNVSPQVGDGFNRDAWNDLEKYVRAKARQNRNLYCCTGPLYLPRREKDGKVYVKYEVIGKNNVAVPTHFFKVLLIENNQGQYELMPFVLPNQPLPKDVKLKKYLVPLESIERAAGFLLFDKIPRKNIKMISG
ncbi:endonuclease G, mitochondrial-like [Mytilus californianus]|uniref:endonuclease G, mitochondrial-like n=1 Tax=Mytilus californianus TaxID=6549 RepID=UPI002247FB66|nr:endonuclease G, mitochondrial-like [Mytilus californianus]